MFVCGEAGNASRQIQIPNYSPVTESQCPSWHLLVRKVDNGDNCDGAWLLSITQEALTMLRWDFHESRLNSANIKQLWGFHIHDGQVNWDNIIAHVCNRGLVIKPTEDNKKTYNRSNTCKAKLTGWFRSRSSHSRFEVASKPRACACQVQLYLTCACQV